MKIQEKLIITTILAVGINAQDAAFIRGTMWRKELGKTLKEDSQNDKERHFVDTAGVTAFVRNFQTHVGKRTESILEDFKSVFPEDYEPAGPDPNFTPIFPEDYTPPAPDAYEDKFTPVFDTSENAAPETKVTDEEISSVFD